MNARLGLPSPLISPAIPSPLSTGSRQPLPNARAGPSNPPAPPKERPPNFEIVIPLGGRRKEYPFHWPAQEDIEPKRLPKKDEYDVLQEPLFCLWQKCKAQLANVTIAKKHYAQHQASVNGRVCGIRRCVKPVDNTIPGACERHYTECHLQRFQPNLRYLALADPGARPIAPLPRHLARPPPLPSSDISPQYLISSPVAPSPLPVEPPSQSGLVPPVLARKARKNSPVESSLGSSSSTSTKYSILPDHGDHPFWPTEGDAISTSSRKYSSYIFPHPEEGGNDDSDKAVVEMGNSMSDRNAVSSMPTFTFPSIPETEAVNTPSPSSSITLRAAVPPKSATRLELRVVPRTQAGPLHVTVPLADIHAEIAKVKARLPAHVPPRDASPDPHVRDGKRRRMEREALKSKIRRAAERVATQQAGRTLGVEWWETMFEVKGSLEEAAKGGRVGDLR